MKLSIVIPVFNEEKLVLDVLRKVASLPLDKEIIVVDDCSKDGTGAVLDKVKADPTVVTSADSLGLTTVTVLRQPVNRGKGAALHRGFAEAKGDIVVVQDADFEYDPMEIPSLIEPILKGEADVVYGSRFLKGHEGFPFWHTLANRMLTVASNLVTGLTVTDMETCYKLIKRPIVQALTLREERFGFEPEVTAQLGRYRRKHGLKLVERPVSYHPRSIEQGKKIRLKDAFRAVYCIVRYGLFK
ncbi:MAG: glycosyltransferase family 2 protein [Deltaproteobacteria bacterium]|nr:glycosyltransferase family 2 protein [Deltaproteobacteria bacterium]